MTRPYFVGFRGRRLQVNCFVSVSALALLLGLVCSSTPVSGTNGRSDENGMLQIVAAHCVLGNDCV